MDNRNKLIHFEAQRVSSVNARGISYYEINLVKNLIQRARFKYEISFFDYHKEMENRRIIEERLGKFKDYVRFYECNDISYKDIIRSSAEGNLSIYQGQEYNDFVGINGRVDLFHFMNANMFPLNIPDNSIVTAHDCMGIIPGIRESFSETFQKSFVNCHKFLEKNKRITIIADSESTKEDITKYFDIEAERIFVVPLGIDHDFYYKQTDKSILKKYKIVEPYIFYIGAVEERKGVFDLIEAYRMIRKRYDGIQLVIAGGIGARNKDKYEPIIGAEDINYIGYISDDDKRALLSSAEMFVFPSRYEGFGLPILEAMSCECPVITSNISSLPEVGGDAVEYVEPESVEDLAYVIRRLMDDEKRRRDMSNLGKKRARIFSWERCAKETENVYSNVLRSVT